VIALLSLVLAQIDFPWVLAGHGYDVGGGPARDGSGVDDEGGISTRWIVAVLLVALITAGVLVSLDPGAARKKLRSVGPKALIAVFIAAPLVAWTASAGGEKKGLIVERAIGPSGAPELLVSLGDEELNTLGMTNGATFVRVECVGRDGQVVVDGRHRWPFTGEVSFDSPHAHQPASRKQLRQADRCRLRGTHARLEADVEGALPR
jgi:hypothetical protein